MILGRIIGKTSTKQFAFKVEGDAHIFDYVQVMHNSGDFALAQIEEIEKDSERAVAFCSFIGYRDEEGKLQGLKSPVDPGIEVLRADDEFVRDILGLEKGKHSAYIGVLDGRDALKVYLDLDKVLSRHVVVLAKSGSGKSYCSSVLLEELLLKKVPVVVIDPHGEYSSLKFPNPKDKEKMIQFGIEAKGFLKQIEEFSPDITLNPEAKPLKLSNRNLSSQELIHLLPTKISSSQLGLVYAALKNIGGRVDFNDLIIELEASEDNNSKWTLIHIFEYVKKLNLFSENATLMGDLVQPGKMSIINLRGVSADVQELVVYKVISDLFAERKKNTIPPFFLVVEECHNFVPERNFGEAKSSAIIRQVAAEGRKFGLGLCLISQRPSRVDKCLHPWTKVITETNEFFTLEELYDYYSKTNNLPNILAFDSKTNKITPTKVLTFCKSEKKEKVYTLKTSRGYIITGTSEHKFFCLGNGSIIEKKIKDISTNDILLVAKNIPYKPNNKLTIGPLILQKWEERKRKIKQRIYCYKEIRGDKTTLELSRTYGIPKSTIRNWKIGIQSPCYLHRSYLLDKNLIFGEDLMKEAQPIPIIKTLTPHFARFIAFLVSESNERMDSSYSIRFVNKDFDLIKQFEEACFHLFKIKPIIQYSAKKNIYVASLNSILLKEYLDAIGYNTCQKSINKDIPSFILTADYNCIQAFLQSYFDGDGSVTNKGVVLSSASFKLIEKSSFLFKKLSVEHTIYRKKQKINDRDYYSWQLIILTHELEKFATQIGFSSVYKKRALEELLKRTKTSRKEIIHNYVPISKQDFHEALKKSGKTPKRILKSFSKISNHQFITTKRAQLLLPYLDSKTSRELIRFLHSDLRTDKIVSISLEKNITHTYDLETEYSNFLANFILTHNSAISQASTQLILKLTNPNDIKAVSNSIEGITLHTEKEIQNIPVGTALVTGVVDLPLLVNIRPRMSKHGGEAVSSFLQEEGIEEGESFTAQEKSYQEEGESLPLIKQQFTMEDVKLMHGHDTHVTLELVPAVMMSCSRKGEEFRILIDLLQLQVIDNLEQLSGVSLLKLQLEGINPKQEELLGIAVKLGETIRANDLFAKSGMQFSELYETMTVLVRKGYFVREGNDYKLSSSMAFLANIDQKQAYSPLSYAKSSGEKIPAKYSYEVVKDFLNKFFEVKAVKECFIEKYNVS
ncbi:DUF87 domain-containing protein [Candidatus Woesearchaeota archaeon]|nr:DUF87 domain-containing protein [Candidatus Woesearchaeota archaeon]